MPSRIFSRRPLAPLRFQNHLRTPRQRPWVCASCQHHQVRRSSNKPFYVTTPIFYVNANPHVGHMYTMILGDILKRWQQLLGNRAILLTGTDEHGMKIQRAAAEANTDPKAFCDRGAQTFKTLAETCNVSYDRFIRTTDEDHKETVSLVWGSLKESGYIYPSKHEGWYSVSDETFYPDSGVHLVLDPPTGRKMMASIETGKEVEWTSETNYHFKLSEFQDRLLSFYEKHPNWIQPKQRQNLIISQVEEGLEDLSVSRPSQRLQWGIRVPDDPSQTIYVWLDALINYITAAGYPWAPGSEHLSGWPASVQVLGKDIIRFHCVYWPAFLMALRLPIPDMMLTHAHWTLGNTGKMSKSSGNVVNPFFAIDRFGVDTMRFYLAHEGGIKDDSAYSNTFIIEKYKKNLQGSLGNLTSRILRGKKWNVGECVDQNHEELSRNYPPYPQDKDQYAQLDELPREVERLMREANIPAALKTIMSLIWNTNKYLQARAPWHFGTNEANSGEDWQQERSSIIFLCAESLRISGILLQPFIPGKAKQLLDMLGVAEARRSFEWAGIGKDPDYGNSGADLGRGTAGVLFPPLSSDE